MGRRARSLARRLAYPLQRSRTLLRQSRTGARRVRPGGRESLRELPFGAVPAAAASREGFGKNLRGGREAVGSASVSCADGDSLAAVPRARGVRPVSLLQGIWLRSAGEVKLSGC